MLKCKSFNDNEYEVISHEIGPMRFVENGSQVELEVLTSVDIIHKGFRVQVGSGFSKEQRLKYKEHPELIDGATITVQYFEETKNQDGGISLRFPTVKAVYENGRDV
jgi:DNA ligase-1